MAERLKDQLIEKEAIVDVIAGPDSYRSLPYLLSQASSHQVLRIHPQAQLFPIAQTRLLNSTFFLLPGCYWCNPFTWRDLCGRGASEVESKITIRLRVINKNAMDWKIES